MGSRRCCRGCGDGEEGVKQTLFMAGVTAIGVLGSFSHGPFIGVAVYYFFAVLRPQYLWEWSLPEGVAWSQYVAFAALVASAMALIGFIRQDDKGFLHYASLAHAPLIGFFLWLTVSYMGAIDQAVAWPWFLEYMKIALMFVVGMSAIRTISQVWCLYVVATIAICYIAWEMNMLYLQFGYLSIWRRGYGGLDNNGAGLIMAMGVPLALAAWEGTRKWYRWAYLAMVVFLIHAVLMSYSRGAMVALIAAAPIIGVLSSQKRRVGMAALGLLLLLPYLAGDEIRDRFFSVRQYEQDGSAQSRFDSWSAAWDIASDYPISGAGIRNANLLSYQYGADMEGRTIHSQYLQIAADNGFVGLGLYLWSLLAVATATVRTRLRSPLGDEYGSTLARAVSNGVIGAMAVFCVGALFLSLEVFELPFLLLLLGAQVSSIDQEREIADTPPRDLGEVPADDRLREPALVSQPQRRW